MLGVLGDIFRDDRHTEYFFFFFPRKQDLALYANCLPLETIDMKGQILFSGKNKKNVILSSAELAKKVVKLKSEE